MMELQAVHIVWTEEIPFSIFFDSIFLVFLVSSVLVSQLSQFLVIIFPSHLFTFSIVLFFSFSMFIYLRMYLCRTAGPIQVWQDRTPSKIFQAPSFAFFLISTLFKYNFQFVQLLMPLSHPPPPKKGFSLDPPLQDSKCFDGPRFFSAFVLSPRTNGMRMIVENVIIFIHRSSRTLWFFNAIIHKEQLRQK